MPENNRKLHQRHIAALGCNGNGSRLSLNCWSSRIAPLCCPVYAEQCAGVFFFQQQRHRGSSPRNTAPHQMNPACG
jgi:hypothetical protein